MATPSQSTRQANTAPSAWGRLVQMTKTASKSSRQVAAPQQNNIAASSSPSTTARAVKTPRIATSPSRSSSSRSSVSAAIPKPNTTPKSPRPYSTRQSHATKTHPSSTALPGTEEAISIEVCPCLEGQEPLPGGKCSLSQSSERRTTTAPTRTSISPRVSDIRSLWGRPSSVGAGVHEDKPNLEYGRNRDKLAPLAQQPAREDSRHVTGEACATATVDEENLRPEKQPVCQGNLSEETALPNLQSDEAVLCNSNSNALNSNHPPHEDKVLADATQLATPTSSQDTTSTDQALFDNDENNPAPVRKAKRRLTLHSNAQPSHKKRRTAPAKKKQTVQTTLALAIGGNSGMRECKVCDTVYNPLHPEDVKVHAKRHAGALKKRANET